jgi:hypothetical protein
MESYVTFLIYKIFATRREVSFVSIDYLKISKSTPTCDLLKTFYQYRIININDKKTSINVMKRSKMLIKLSKTLRNGQER